MDIKYDKWLAIAIVGVLFAFLMFGFINFDRFYEQPRQENALKAAFETYCGIINEPIKATCRDRFLEDVAQHPELQDE